MGLLEFFAALSGTNAGIKNNQKKNQKKKQQDDFDWETCCENCGELLEDCECDDQELSFEDIAMMDMIDEDDEAEQEDFLSGQDDDEDTCGDCGCRVGEQHYPSCDIERCPCCGGQFYSCACGVKYSVDLQKTEIIPLLIKEQERENKKLQRELDIFYKKQNRRTKNKDAEM